MVATTISCARGIFQNLPISIDFISRKIQNRSDRNIKYKGFGGTRVVWTYLCYPPIPMKIPFQYIPQHLDTQKNEKFLGTCKNAGY